MHMRTANRYVHGRKVNRVRVNKKKERICQNMADICIWKGQLTEYNSIRRKSEYVKNDAYKNVVRRYVY